MTTIPFTSLIKKYDVILFDSYGVIKNYNGVIDGAQETLHYLREKKTRYRVLTNDASRSPEILSDKFAKLGITIKPHRIITSGMMARHFLETKRIDGKVLYLGTDLSADYIIAANHEAIPVRDYNDTMMDDIGCVVFLDDEGYHWRQDVNKVLNLLRQKPIPSIVANSDLIYPVSKNNVSLGTGSIAQLIENVLQRKFIHFGKPDVQMFIHAYEDLKRDDPTLEKSKLLMVGDTLSTDILGAVKFGINTALVLSGNTTRRYAPVAIQSTGITPDYICESITQ